MRHSSKNAIPTKPQKQPAIAQNFHIKKSGGEKKEGKKARDRATRERRREVPVVAAAVLVCLPADEPQGSHGTFEAKRGEPQRMRGRGRLKKQERKEGERRKLRWQRSERRGDESD